MTKSPQSVSKLPISKICKLILTLGLIKLSLLIGLVFVPEQKISVAVAANAPFSSNLIPETSAKDQIDLPKPNINKQESPFARSLNAFDPKRPDEAIKADAPAPKITPLIPQDSATRKQDELNRREQELLALQQQMQSRLDELKSIEGKVETMLKEAGTTQDDKLKHLIDVYSNMKAKQAAEVLTNLDERIAVKILAGMRGRQAGEILTYMNAEKAAKLSEALTRTQLPK